jgi:hypothetical protein
MKLRTGAHYLAIETGRWANKPRDERLCKLCTRSVVEDEFHMLFECPSYTTIRADFEQELFSRFGGRANVVARFRHHPKHVAQFMDQEPRHVAAFVHACFEHHRNAEYDYDAHFSVQGLGFDMHVGDIFDNFSSDYVQSSGETSVEDSGGSIVAHGARVGSSRAPHT